MVQPRLSNRGSLTKDIVYHPKTRQKLYIPKVITHLIWALTTDSTRVHYKEDDFCAKHRVPLDIDHITSCDNFKQMEKIPEYLAKIKSGENIHDWPEQALKESMMLFASLAMQLSNLKSEGLVLTRLPADDHPMPEANTLPDRE